MYSNTVMWRELIHRGGEAFQQEQYLLAKERFQQALNLAEVALNKAQTIPAFVEQLTEQPVEPPAEQVVQQFLIACCNLADTHNMMGDSEVADYYYQCAWQSLQSLISATNIAPCLRQQAIIQLEKAAKEFTELAEYPVNSIMDAPWHHANEQHYGQSKITPIYH
ncbi:hypothetical protein H0A36_14320 [Endozoicomonas sp. SM1973]|uniref:Tetratricopeptide repeat protein n=1 Tax=Spartinivicinus marinus TaxID=2994442 RepID=A0A853I3J6_9GAMM|nr:hypothetical protein [Spartinivicinus marinus]MCX4028522.1 hypothetical protein [Spartinivicinus marinus]NYZ67189.1 hypothetical protein [Spartinivicinus marinus]